MKRILTAVFLQGILFFVLCFAVEAQETSSLPEMPVPPAISDYLGNPPQDADALVGWFNVEKLFDFGKSALEGALPGVVKCFFGLAAVAALSAVMAALSESVENKGVINAFQYMAVLCGAAVTLALLQEIFDGVVAHVETLTAFASGVIPIYAGVSTAGGMSGLSFAGGGGLSLAASFAALLANKVLLPLLRVCFILSFSASVSGLSGIAQISATVRRFFVGAVGGIAALLTAVFAFQTEIAAKADTLAGRAVRYVTSSALPLVGGALSEASRTLSSAFSLVGGMVGGVGVAVVVLLLLPVLLELWLLRLCFVAAGGIADILHCERIGVLYRDGGELLGALMAILSLVDAVLVFEFALLMRI